MNYFASPSFWEAYYNLPIEIQNLADKNFELLKENPQHPSLHLKIIILQITYKNLNFSYERN